MHLSMWALIKGQFDKQPPVVKTDLTGKTVVTVGTNTGLGFEAAKHFARMNPGRLILACRSQSRGQAAVDTEGGYGRGYTHVELWLIELGDFESVKHFADRFERDGGRLDILVENTAVSMQKYEATKDGWETSLQVNCLSTPLVAFLLLPSMIRTAQEHATIPRLVVVASETHYWVTISRKIYEKGNILATLGNAKYCTTKAMRMHYPLTKLLNVFFVRALNSCLGASLLIVDAVNPGFCVSKLRRNISGPVAWLANFMEWIMAFTTEEGGHRLVHGAVGILEDADTLLTKMAWTRGGYLNQCRVEEPSNFVVSAEGHRVQDQIWVSLLTEISLNVLTSVQDELIEV
ncbi:hypothetical protein DFH07DRAFT_738005 [Mycena maculata]|uniref:NAD(P)-binding protein n=1 Tax=Mycena maculata TaxID=230809 RepID=A0AAD7JLQ8_9AGAR|nr:hypothetical protein DFH07DRAFT_738005 [Mycena maculata]